MRILYTPEARLDLVSAKQYIIDNFFDENAAKKLAKNILEKVSLLETNPDMGINLEDRIQKKTDLKILIVEKHIVFYRVKNSEIHIIRILDSRTDYMKEIF